MAVYLNWIRPKKRHQFKVAIEFAQNLVNFTPTGREANIVSKITRYYMRLERDRMRNVDFNFSSDMYKCSLLPVICGEDYIIQASTPDQEYHLFLYLRDQIDSGGEMRHYLLSDEEVNMDLKIFIKIHIHDGDCQVDGNYDTVADLFPETAKVLFIVPY